MFKLCWNCIYLKGHEKGDKYDKDKLTCDKDKKLFEGVTCSEFKHKE